MTEDQLSTIWKSVLGDIQAHFSNTVFKTWFKPTRLAALTDGKATISVENNFAQNFINKYAEEQILSSLSAHSGVTTKTLIYEVEVASKPAKKSAPAQNQNLFTGESGGSEPVAPVYELPPAQHFTSNGGDGQQMTSNLNPKYTFSTFIVGNRNRLAHAAARAVAESPGKTYNPLYLYGGVGLGKTHLMQAVGNEVIRREPQKRILYVSCENFTNEFTAAIRSGKIDNFKKKYRTIDIFLVDDIQFIAGKEGTQEEFFHTFNALYQTDKQIIITSDKVPRDIPNLEERLSSRFSMGMIADMQLPDLETRQAILQSKCEEKGINLSSEVLFYMADLVETNIRELEGALTRVISVMKTDGREPSIELVRDALKDYSATKPLKKTSMEQIRQIVCDFYGVDFKDVIGQRRQAEIVKPRQIMMYLMKNELGMTFPTIGREIGGRDHTTAMHSVEKIEKEMKKSPELLEELKHLKELFYGGVK